MPATTAAGENRLPAARWPRWVFRVVSAVAAILLFDQAVYAGQFLDGTYGSLHDHRENATYAGISVLVLLAASILLRWPGRGPWWPIPACIGIFALIGLQIALGFARAISVHVPLGVATILAAVGLALWAWRRP